MNNLSIPTKQELEDRYLKQSMSMQKIASEFKMSVGKIHKLIHFYEIPTRDQKESFTMKGRKLTQEQRERISKIHKGKQLSEETKQKISQSHIKGGIGHKKQGKDG